MSPCSCSWMIVVIVEALHLSAVLGARLPDIYWNETNPIFRIDNTDHIIDVNRDNSLFEYDQVNIVCPKHDSSTPEEDTEKFIIYNVSKEEYDSCAITDFSRAKIVAQCNKPYQSMCFTITFRSFTPQPGGLEFKPGMDYYFIAAPENLRQGENHCLTKNMRVQFKVCCKEDTRRSTTTTSTTTSTTTTTQPSQIDENVIYPFYRFPAKAGPVFPNQRSSHEASTQDYWPQYPHVPRKKHERHHKPAYKPVQPTLMLPDRPTVVNGEMPMLRDENNSIQPGRIDRKAKKEGFTNGSWTVRALLPLISLLMFYSLLSR